MSSSREDFLIWERRFESEGTVRFGENFRNFSLNCQSGVCFLRCRFMHSRGGTVCLDFVVLSLDLMFIWDTENERKASLDGDVFLYLRKDDRGVWRGEAVKEFQQHHVNLGMDRFGPGLDYYNILILLY